MDEPGSRDEGVSPASGARLASLALAALAVVSPWAMGGAPEWARRSLTLLALAAATLAALARTRGSRRAVDWQPVAPLVALVALAGLQLVPLPSRLHALLAPGSARLWSPPAEAAAAVLGPGMHPLSIFPAATVSAGLWVLGLTALAALGAPALREPRWRSALGTALVAGGLVVAVYGIVARVFFGPLLFGAFAVPTVSPFGPFVSKNHFAAYAAALAILALGLAIGAADAARLDRTWLSWVRSPRAPRVVLAFGACLILVLAVLVAQSRGGALGLFAGAVVLLGLRLSSRRALTATRVGIAVLAMVAAAAVVLALVPPEARERLASLAGAPDASGRFRVGIWKDAVRAFRAAPSLGHGLGAFADALPPHKTAAGELRVEHAENDFVELLVEGGAAAFLILAWGAAALLRSCGRARSLRGADRGLALGAAGALAAIAVQGVFDFPLHLPAVAAVAAIAASLLLATTTAEASSPSTRRGVFGAVAVLALALVAAATTGPRPGRAGSLPAVRLATARGLAGPAPSRAQLAEDQVVQHLRSRPADAEGWAVLAWLRARAGSAEEAAALARHAAALDPARTALVDYARSLEGRARH